LAHRVDFISVGSNDLTQYLLAVDRNNARVADLYHQFHPAVLQALSKIAQDTLLEGKRLSICGEIAGDPGAAILLMAMGYTTLSMSANNLPRVKSVVRQVSTHEAKQLLDDVMHMEYSPDVQRAITRLMHRHGLSRLFIANAD
jgi:phosphotransferase system enzyme I (PtsP)